MINIFDVKKRIDAFEARHGTPVRAGGWVYFADGATRDGNQMGPMNEPPREPIFRCRNIVRYHQILLDRQVREFDELKEQSKGDSGVSNAEENILQLKRLRCNVRQRQRKLEAAQLELKKVMPGYLPPAEAERRRQADAAHEAAKDQYRKRLDEINI